MGEIRQTKQPLSIELLATEDEAIEILGLRGRKNPKGSLRWLMRTKRLPHVRMARGINVFERSALAEYIRQHRVPCRGLERNG